MKKYLTFKASLMLSLAVIVCYFLGYFIGKLIF